MMLWHWRLADKSYPILVMTSKTELPASREPSN